VLAPLLAVATVAQALALAGPSSTELSLSTDASAYGQGVTATATVSATGPAQGDVVFTVDGLDVKANLGGGGTASLVLSKALVGQHAVAARFVPQFPAVQEPSASPTRSWTVSQVRTRLQVRVIGRGARIPTSVEVRAAGEYGTRPAGRVKVVARRVGTRARVRDVQRLSSTGMVLARLGRLSQGDYRLEVTYVGDSQHLRERHVERFHVRR
jgi:hypothetical protein